MRKKVLNVGGSSKEIPIPGYYSGWEHLLLDIDPDRQPDILCDARDLASLPPNGYDAIYCSHTLEHFYQHDVHQVLAGFQHLLVDTGFAEIRVPDIGAVMDMSVAKQLDIEDVLYDSPSGPIRVHDVLYGFGKEIKRSGNNYFAHKCGFTESSLLAALKRSGFPLVYSGRGNLEIRAYAFRKTPAVDIRQLLALPPV